MKNKKKSVKRTTFNHVVARTETKQDRDKYPGVLRTIEFNARSTLTPSIMNESYKVVGSIFFQGMKDVERYHKA